jgi:hypothetical protein
MGFPGVWGKPNSLPSRPPSKWGNPAANLNELLSVAAYSCAARGADFQQTIVITQTIRAAWRQDSKNGCKPWMAASN